jgi:hypothetical protein
MSLVLFFGFAALVVVVGLIYSGLVLHHHWRQGKQDQLKKNPKTAQ